LFKILDLENFLKEHESEWWTPHEIGKELGIDRRTIKNVIRRLDIMTHGSWRLDIAERGNRLYVVRMVRDVEISRNIIKTEASKVKCNRIRVNKSSKLKQTYLMFDNRT